MQEKLFRAVALERLSSPERLDELMRVTEPRGWLALVGACGVILAVILWGIWGSVPTLLRGQGFLVREGSLRTVDAPTAGRVREIPVRVGDSVVAGQAVARLARDADAEVEVVTSPHAGRVRELRVAEGDVVAGGAALVSLEQAGGPLEAILYLPPADAKRVQPGMTVQLSPAAVNRQEHGLLLGRVSAVGALPASVASMRRALGSEELATWLAAGGPRVEVRVALEPDPAGPGGYRWTSSRGAPIALESGTPCTADIVIDEQAPIELVLPGFTR